MSVTRVKNPNAIILCAAVVTLAATVALGQQVLDGVGILSPAPIVQQAPAATAVALKTDRASPKLPGAADCDDFAFSFLHSTCAKAHTRHTARLHRVASSVINHPHANSSVATTDQASSPMASKQRVAAQIQSSAAVSVPAVSQRPMTAYKKPKAPKDTARRTIVGMSGDWMVGQNRPNTTMRVFSE